MNPLCVVIPSKNETNLVTCVNAVRDKEPGVRIVVVDDFPAGTRPVGPFFNDVDWREGIHPFVFARNINLGIAGCPKDSDVVLLNDDAVLETRNGLTKMQRELVFNPEYGLLGATCTPHATTIREERYMVPFICVLIPRRTIEIVGLLDERFVGYGYEDDDYCLRVRLKSMKVGTYTGCYVNHSSLKSTFRVTSSRPPGLALAREIFCDKWGSHPL